MLANAKSYCATVSRQAELAKDNALAHALAQVVATIHAIIESTRRDEQGFQPAPLRRI